jgi:FkbM family methyltransferase
MTAINTFRFLSNHPLTRHQKLSTILRFLRWQVQSRINRELVVPWIEETVLAVRRGMTGATGNIYVGLHEFSDMAFVLHFIRADDLFVDIGANIGSYTLLASAVNGARSVAFEPDPGAVCALNRNLEMNGIAQRVAVHATAVGASSCHAHFSVGLGSRNCVATEGKTPTRIVEMTTLDRVLDEQFPVLLKLDVEGYECEVLKGAKKALAKSSLKAVLTEDCSAPVEAAFQEHGFESYSYDVFSRTLVPFRNKSFQSNVIFVRDIEFVQQRLWTARKFIILGVEL